MIYILYNIMWSIMWPTFIDRGQVIQYIDQILKYFDIIK